MKNWLLSDFDFVRIMETIRIRESVLYPSWLDLQIIISWTATEHSSISLKRSLGYKVGIFIGGHQRFLKKRYFEGNLNYWKKKPFTSSKSKFQMELEIWKEQFLVILWEKFTEKTKWESCCDLGIFSFCFPRREKDYFDKTVNKKCWVNTKFREKIHNIHLRC